MTPDQWKRIEEKARDWRYSNEFIGILVRRLLAAEGRS